MTRVREIYEFRVTEEYASALFSESEGKRLNLAGIRQVFLSPDDPRIAQLGKLRAENKRFRRNELVWSYWNVRRTYERDELNAATLFCISPTAFFEPTGEQCGTTYDEKRACPICGSGAPIVGPLRLDVGRIPRKDVASSIAAELIVSSRARDLFEAHAFTGATFRPVIAYRSNTPSKKWYEPVITSDFIEIAPQTVTGNDVFDLDQRNEFRCPRGHLIGARVISETFVRAETVGSDDILLSRQFIGGRSGLLRPNRLLFVSARLFHALRETKFTGFEYEIARLV